MSNDTLVNARSPVTKKSTGTVVTGPDVCKTPTPGGPVPIPYPNIAKSGDLAKGSKNVSINGAPVCLDSSNFSTSIGDDAGVLKGVISNTHKGKAHPINGSFDVKIEGKSVVRNVDMFSGNDKNTLPAPIVQAQVTPVVVPPVKEDPCPYCDKKPHVFAKKAGDNVGNSNRLRRNIIADVEGHRWYTRSGALQAHHLICTKAMEGDRWFEFCRDFGYNINCKENGVMLPSYPQLACLLHVPLHISHHSAGEADGQSYPGKISNDIEEIAGLIEDGTYCDNPQGLVDDLNQYSVFVLNQLKLFLWTITNDGKDYDVKGNGCGGVTSIKNKPNNPCPHNRQHLLINKDTKVVLSRNIVPLEVGK